MAKIKVYLMTGSEIDLSYNNAETAEDVCLNLCKRLNFPPSSKCIFGLRLFDNVGKRKVWLAPSSKIDKNEKYELRIRFKVSTLETILLFF